MASTVKKSKGTIKELHTFLKWGKSEIIGHKIEIFDSKQYVTRIWCKLSSKYRDQIVSHPTIKGAAVSAVRAFADGTEVVTKYQVNTNKFRTGLRIKLFWGSNCFETASWHS